MVNTQSRPNVLFLLVDAVRFDRLGIGGNIPAPAPFLDSLLERGIWASEAFTPGCPTQFALPCIFTSTLPLDQGGYGSGIRDRSASFVEPIRAAGYRTGAFVSVAWAHRFDGYDRGFDNFYQLFDISILLRIFRDFNIKYYADLVNASKLSRQEFAAQIVPLLDKVFPFLACFCREKMNETASGALAPSPVIHGWDFRQLMLLIKNHEFEFRRSPETYLDAMLASLTANTLFGAVVNARTGQPQDSSARYVLENLSRWIERPSARPFFAWAHLMDVHDSNYTSYDTLPSRDDLQGDIARLLDMQARIVQAGNRYRSAPEHDYSLSYVDEQLRRFFGFLKQKKLLDNTLIVIASDHGNRTSGLPRPDFKDIAAFFDQLYRVPIGFVHPDLPPRRIDGFCSTMDIGPTLLDILGLPAPRSFRGRSLMDPARTSRDYLQMEHLGRGPCDFSLKPINVCVRTRERKIVYRSWPMGNPGTDGVDEAYDLMNDPDELHNKASDLAADPRAAALITIARQRCVEIRNGIITCGTPVFSEGSSIPQGCMVGVQ
jgi:arylsulfatase A-like enzyme